jgi:seryl-tRNA synthetase
MLDIKRIRNNTQYIKDGVHDKGYDSHLVDTVLQLDDDRRSLEAQIQALRQKRNELAKGRAATTESKDLKEQLQKMEDELKGIETTFYATLNGIPNMPFDDVPRGTDDSENKTIKTWGEPTTFDFTPLDHIELGKSLDILDFESGAKVAGSKFYFLYNEGVLLEFALMLYLFRTLQKEGFVPTITPDVARSRYYLGTGYLPKGDEAQTYVIEDEDLGLIATAEVTLAGKFADTVLDEDQLPLKYIGHSHAFRKEEGAYGRYSHGLYRVHQFSKAELFVYCLAEQSEELHRRLLAIEERIYQELGIPYRVIEMCTGDLGAMAARKFDIEAWMPSRNDYGEVTSASNCTDYQARNLNIRVKRKDGKVEYVHMLNGTAIAMSRTPIAILENFQNSDGSVTIPQVLVPYMGLEKIERLKT